MFSALLHKALCPDIRDIDPEGRQEGREKDGY